MSRVWALGRDSAGDVEGSRALSTRKRLDLLIGDQRGPVVTLAGCSMLSGATEAVVLALIAEIASKILQHGKGQHVGLGPLSTHQSVGTLLIIAGVLSFVRLLVQIPMAVLPARIAAGVQAGLRKRIYDAFTRSTWEVQSRDREGHLQEIMTGQVMQATSGALSATNLVTSLFTFIVLMVSAWLLNARAAVIVLVTAVVLFGVLRPLTQLGVRRARELSRAQIRYAGGISESNRVAEETQVFGTAPAQRRRMDTLILSARDLFFRNQIVARLVPSLYQSLVYLILVGALAAVYAEGPAHAASLGGAVLVLYRAGSFGQAVQSAWQTLRQALPFIERLQKAEARYRESIPPEGTARLQSVDTLAFENVSYAYRPGALVLRDVSFAVDRGEAIGIIGPSGAGKSTLVQILLQLRVPIEGRYLVNGAPAEQFARTDWHRLVAYVPQEPRLVHNTVAENIRYFRAIDDEQVERAAQLARIHDDIVAWPNGYQTIVGPRADAVSGGQQQRICLARALAARPEVLVLDEPTSALDPHSEVLIQESLAALRDELTLFVVAHRMSTLDVCGRVMVVVDGRLVAFDTTELLQTRSDYYRSASRIAAGAGGGLLP